MPDVLNKQAIVNLLIDSPLREPIKINLIDIVNNTAEQDLPKVYSTITKELEIFQKATERRMKLAEETIAKLSGSAPAETPSAAAPTAAEPSPMTPPPSPAPVSPAPQVEAPPAPASLTATPLDLPPASEMPKLTPTETPAPSAPPAGVTPVPAPQPLGAPALGTSSDEEALAEIQKELDSLKTEAASDIAAAGQPAAPAAAPAQA